MDEETSAAVDVAVDAVAGGEPTQSENGTGDDCGEGTTSKVRKEPKTAAEAVKAMNSLGSDVSGKSVIKTSIETFRMSDGKVHKTDLYADDEDKALDLLHEMATAAAKKAGGVESKKGIKWKFRTVPHEQFGRALDDVFRAFLRWAAVDDADATEHGEELGKKKELTKEVCGGGINVSKAYRRLDSYASWMEEAADDLLRPGPLEARSIRGAWDAWKMRLSYDARGRLVWWFDFGAIDLGQCKKIPPEESLRLFVWLSHAIMFDENAQKNGMVVAEDCAKIGFWEAMTMFPMKLGLKLDRLTIGVLPVKMKKLYILDTPVWCDILMKMMGAFMSKKMKKRVIMVKDKEHAVLLDELGGIDCVLVGFGRCGGTMKKCIITDAYFVEND